MRRSAVKCLRPARKRPPAVQSAKEAEVGQADDAEASGGSADKATEGRLVRSLQLSRATIA